MTMRPVLSAVIIFAAGACTAPAGGDAADVEPQALAPVYRYFAAYDASPEVPDSLRPGVEAFMKVTGAPSATDSALGAWAASRAVRVFTPDVDSVFPSLRDTELALGRILANAASEGLRLPHRSYAAVVWGRPESMVFCDSLMLIALNHYLGSDYPGYSHLPSYSRAMKTPRQLACDMAEALVGNGYPYARTAESTVLSRLLYEGSMAEARVRLCGVGAARALGYDDATYDSLLAHESELWQLLVSRGLLYSTLPSDAERLVAPAPSVPSLAQNVPGRAGRFIGHRIVCAYQRRHPEAGLEFLLSPGFFNSDSTLRLSGYTGM